MLSLIPNLLHLCTCFICWMWNEGFRALNSIPFTNKYEWKGGHVSFNKILVCKSAPSGVPVPSIIWHTWWSIDPHHEGLLQTLSLSKSKRSRPCHTALEFELGLNSNWDLLGRVLSLTLAWWNPQSFYQSTKARLAFVKWERKSWSSVLVIVLVALTKHLTKAT